MIKKTTMQEPVTSDLKYKKRVFVFGNINVDNDSLPLRILPELQSRFPEITFEVRDPNEEWGAPEEFTIIDTVQGIKGVKVFYSLEEFVPAPRVSMHDFDALTNLRYLQKLGKIKKVTVIGLSPEMEEVEALKKISEILS